MGSTDNPINSIFQTFSYSIKEDSPSKSIGERIEEIILKGGNTLSDLCPDPKDTGIGSVFLIGAILSYNKDDPQTLIDYLNNFFSYSQGGFGKPVYNTESIGLGNFSSLSLQSQFKLITAPKYIDDNSLSNIPGGSCHYYSIYFHRFFDYFEIKNEIIHLSGPIDHSFVKFEIDGTHYIADIFVRTQLENGTKAPRVRKIQKGDIINLSYGCFGIVKELDPFSVIYRWQEVTGETKPKELQKPLLDIYYGENAIPSFIETANSNSIEVSVKYRLENGTECGLTIIKDLRKVIFRFCGPILNKESPISYLELEIDSLKLMNWLDRDFLRNPETTAYDILLKIFTMGRTGFQGKLRTIGIAVTEKDIRKIEKENSSEGDVNYILLKDMVSRINLGKLKNMLGIGKVYPLFSEGKKH